MSTGSSTGAGPICTMQRRRTAKASSPAAGIPATPSMIPASSAWIAATPITPRDTLRMVSPARSTKPAPREATTRSAKARSPAASRGPET